MDPEHSPAAAEGGTDETEGSKRAAQDETSANIAARGWLGRLLGWEKPVTGTASPESSDAVSLGRAVRALPPAERAMVTNILRLRDLRVEDVMTPRADVIGVAEDATLDEVIVAADKGSHSRLPVYRDTLDDPIGFVHVKDIALRHGFGKSTEGFRLADHVRTALFVPPSMRIAALLQKMQGDRVHMALVIDEFGGVDGLVTIEDLVEQIVGDIEDEHDEAEEEEWVREGDGAWLVQARADIREFQSSEGLDLLPQDWEEDVDTIGGLVFMLANRVPTRGEVIVHPSGYEFEIVDADPRRIKRVRVREGSGRSDMRQAAE